MTLDSFEMVFYTLAFLVPGFIMHSTLAVFTPKGAEQPGLTFLRFLTLSAFNYGIWSWLVYLVYKTRYYSAHPARTAAIWAVVILCSPLLLGVIGGIWSRKDLGRRMLLRLGINPIHPIPTGWDFKFSRMEDCEWVLITLKDGSQVAGLFGSASFASSEPPERDLYVQEVFQIDGDGYWRRLPGNEGILIRSDEIKCVEFWNDNGEKESAGV